jgi:hypothetical protein
MLSIQLFESAIIDGGASIVKHSARLSLLTDRLADWDIRIGDSPAAHLFDPLVDMLLDL